MAARSPHVDTSPHVADEIKYTTCYMCACRCGIRVHLRDGQLRYIDGNPDHPVNRGVLCAKGSAGIMQQNSPAKLSKPLKRTGPRGSGEFVEIEWDEAMDLAAKWLGDIRKTDPRKLAFFTGRDQSQALTGFWASQFGTPNYAAHGGFCSVNMATAGLYTIGSSFWEFGEPDWDQTKYLLMFGVAEDHDSNPIKIGLGKLGKRPDARFVSVNPVRTGYSGIADEWLGIKPGTDGLFVMALIHELLRTEKVDLDYLVRYTNAHWLVRQAPGADNDGLFVRNSEGQPLAWDRSKNASCSALEAGIAPQLTGEVVLPDRTRAKPAFALMAERYLSAEYAPDRAADRCGIDADTIQRIARELAYAAFEQEITLDIEWTDWAGRKHNKMIGRPVSMHAMRGISAHSNGFHTCRAIHILQMLLGSIDCPGGFRSKAPFPKPCPPGLKPAGKPGQVVAGEVLPGPPLGFVQSPEDLLVDADGHPARIDGAYSWDYPLASHGLMHLVIRNAWAQDPYPIDTLFMYMANMGWNSSMNTAKTVEMLTDVDEATGEYRIPHIIYSDAFASETVSYADLVLPDTTYLERFDCISLLDRPISTTEGPADAIRQPVLTPDRDVRPFQDVLIDLGARLNLPQFVNEQGQARYQNYPDYLVNREATPGVGSLGGWRGENADQHGRGAPNANQIERYIENQCYWEHHIPENQRYFKHANKDYLEYAAEQGWIPNSDQITLQMYSEPLQTFRLAGQGHGPTPAPEKYRERLTSFFDPLPIWYQPLEEQQTDSTEFPLHAITQRPMAMYHSWGSQNAWLRQIHGWNRLYLHKDLAADIGVDDDDWVWIESHNGKVRGQVRTMNGCNRSTVWTWNAIGKRKGAWNLAEDAEESTKGMLLNDLISDLLPNGKVGNADPVTGQAAWFDLRVRLSKAPAPEASTEPAIPLPPGVKQRPALLRFGQQFLSAGNWRKRASK